MLRNLRLAIWLIGGLALPIALAGSELETTVRFMVEGQWCFIKAGPRPSPKRAVILIHGNGDTVWETGSSWEKKPGEALLIHRLTAAGFLVAQTNHCATPANGMWGNAASQASVAALMAHLRRDRGIEQFDAIAESAGNLILLNLVLGKGLNFRHAVLVAPAISLASMYRCPHDTDRVHPIAEAFGFVPLHGCPGDPIGDLAYAAATRGFDPLILLDAPAAADRMRPIQWMGVYEERDSKCPPKENILALAAVVRSSGVGLKLLMLPAARSHAAPALFKRFADEITAFLVNA